MVAGIRKLKINDQLTNPTTVHNPEPNESNPNPPTFPTSSLCNWQCVLAYQAILYSDFLIKILYTFSSPLSPEIVTALNYNTWKIKALGSTRTNNGTSYLTCHIPEHCTTVLVTDD
jgi:hypothetical protein